MGVGVSGWPLAREVAMLGQLGVVSGTALDTLLIRRLAAGDPGGHMRRALEAFPAPEVARGVLDRYLGTGVEPTPETDSTKPRFRLLPLPRATLTTEREWLMVLANFAEVYLAKQGHAGVVGINYLHKVQFPILPSLYGAILAGVDVVLMGAGIPGDIPGVIDRLILHEPASVTLDVLEAGDERHEISFDPASLWGPEGASRAPLRRPKFLPIVSSATLARALVKKAPGGIDGFVVEAPIAGGHNAPPRGVQQLSVEGEPIYGARDEADLAQMTGLGLPFWLAGGYATRDKFHAALAAGAHGVQVGTVFAFCDESGLDPVLRRRFLESVLAGEGDVFTDPAASPTSFPFKVASLAGTLSDEGVYEERPRLCDLGYLRRAYRRPDGKVGYRCPAEPVEDYVKKGGKAEDTVGRKCLCNGLVSNLGLGQRRSDGYEEPPLLTAGKDLGCLIPFISSDRPSYTARDVVDSLLAPV
jgi:NAD(P)H-dependent flavin oxidoreductase YrpB (nitropropane dioxygenase family)